MEAEDNIQKMYKYFGILADAKENIAEVSLTQLYLCVFFASKMLEINYLMLKTKTSILFLF